MKGEKAIMTKKVAIEVINEFYNNAVFRITKRNRDLYLDHVMDTFMIKTDAIVTACIYSNKSNKVWQEVQSYKYEMEAKLRDLDYSLHNN